MSYSSADDDDDDDDEYKENTTTVPITTANLLQKKASSSEPGVGQLDVSDGITNDDDGIIPGIDELQIHPVTINTNLGEAEPYEEYRNENGADNDDYEGEDMDINNGREPQD